MYHHLHFHGLHHRHRPHALDRDMLHGPLVGPLLRFALPIALSGILQQLFNSADVAVVGQFAGPNALAAVGANSSVINLLINLFVGLSIGAGVVISTLLGQRDTAAIGRAIRTALWLAVVSGLLLAGIGQAAARPILEALGTPAEIIDQAVLYLRIYFAGMPFMMVYNFGAAILRAQGDTQRPLLALTYAGIVNVALNVFFVVGCGMGVEGVAIATCIATACSATYLFVYIRRTSRQVKLRLRTLRPDRHMLRHIALVGIPASLQGMVFSLSNVLIQNSINSLGAEAVAASTTALNFEYYAYYICNSFGQTATTYISQNHGAGQDDRCRLIARHCLWLDAACTLAVSMVFVALARPLCRVYTSAPEVLSLAIVRVYIITSTEWLNGVVECLTGILRGFGHSMQPTVISIAGICGLRILYLYTVFAWHPTFAVLSAVYPVSWVVTSVVMAIAYWRLCARDARSGRLTAGTPAAAGAGAE